MPSIDEEARNMMHNLFSSEVFRGYESSFRTNFQTLRKGVDPKVQKKPYEQFLVAFAAFELAGPDNIDEALGIAFPAGVESADFRTVYDRIVTNKNLFEVQYDDSDMPVAYRLHTNGRFGRRDVHGELHILPEGVEKGGFIRYSEIAEWLRQNR
ncbi:MAG: hypothetical protein HY051_05820 [Candidatus Aenigmarchaeota archaeon]|nr:hypothetical protein [Candidatus Aenigmarchaeota archaeon]